MRRKRIWRKKTTAEHSANDKSSLTAAGRDKITSTSGYVLPFVLIFFTCTLLGGTFLLQNLSDGIQMNQNRLQRLQSRWMAESGWNAAIAHLEMGNEPATLVIETGEGSYHTRIDYDGTDLFTVTAEGTSGDYQARITGTVRWIQMPGQADGSPDESPEDTPEAEEPNPTRNLKLVSRSFTD